MILIVEAATVVVSPSVTHSPGIIIADRSSGLIIGHHHGQVSDLGVDTELEGAPTGSKHVFNLPQEQPEWLSAMLAGRNAEDEIQFEFVRHNGILVPGFVDIHTHGVGGSLDVMKYWHHVDFNRDKYARAGTTSFLATVVFDEDDLETSYKSCDMLRDTAWLDGKGAVVEGIHAEGPIVATLGGLPNTMSLVEKDDQWFWNFIQRIHGTEGAVKMMTISPSCDADRDFSRFKLLCKANIVPCLGHDKICTEAQILNALRVGSDNGFGRFHLTHAFNVQVFHHRECGLANIAFLARFPKLPQYADLLLPSVELIGDGMHVSPIVLQSVADARNVKDWCMITDAISEPVPKKKLSYAGSRVAQVSDDGKCVECCDLHDPSIMKLCGSSTTMLENFRKCVQVFGLSLSEAVAVRKLTTLSTLLSTAIATTSSHFCCVGMFSQQACSTTPSHIARLDHVVGSLESGRRANFIFLTLDDATGNGHDATSGVISLQQVWIGSQCYFLREQAL